MICAQQYLARHKHGRHAYDDCVNYYDDSDVDEDRRGELYGYFDVDADEQEPGPDDHDQDDMAEEE